MGLTPLGMAQVFGPHREVEGELGSVMLDKDFAENYALSQGGRLLVASSGKDSAEETHRDDDITGVEILRAAEPPTNTKESSVGNKPDRPTNTTIPSMHHAVASRSTREPGSQLGSIKQEERRGGEGQLMLEMAGRIDAIEKRFASLDARFDARFDAMEAHFTSSLGPLAARAHIAELSHLQS